jgi:3-hydroxyacyl-[acyl-carrier-protein] dehydratase
VPTLPASILTEAMAQVGAVLVLTKPEFRSKLILFMGIDKVRYRRPVVAGDQVRLEGVVLRMRSRMGSLRGRALVDGELVCQGDMTFALGDQPARG